MSDVFVRVQLHAMKKRLGGWKTPPRYSLLKHRNHTCPGWMGDTNQRREIVFRRHSGIQYRHGHLAYSMYWRLHKEKQ